jgi:hypothetical protein
LAILIIAEGSWAARPSRCAIESLTQADSVMAAAAMAATQGDRPFPFRLNRNGGLDFRFDDFSLCEPVFTSLESVLACIASAQATIDQARNHSTHILLLLVDGPIECALQSLAYWRGLVQLRTD